MVKTWARSVRQRCVIKHKAIPTFTLVRAFTGRLNLVDTDHSYSRDNPVSRTVSIVINAFAGGYCMIAVK